MAAADLIPAPDAGRPGDPIDVRGTGFAPLQAVVVTLEASKVTQDADGNGAFTVSIAVPANATAGPSEVVATQTCAKCVPQTHKFQILPASAHVVPARTLVFTGQTTLLVTGDGWAPQTPVTISFAADTAGAVAIAGPTPRADDGGRFDDSLTIPPDAAAGMYVITACQGCDRSAGAAVAERRATARFRIVVRPSFDVEPRTVLADGTVTVSGANWDPATDVRVFLDRVDGLRVATITPTGGSFRTDITLPSAAGAGRHDLIACQRCDEFQAPQTITVQQPRPTLRARPLTVVAGGRVRVRGANWQPQSLVAVPRWPLRRRRRAIRSRAPLRDGRIDERVQIPPRTGPGRYTLRACQDCAHPVLVRHLRVTAPPPPPPPPAASGHDRRWAFAAGGGAALGLLLLAGVLALRRPTLAFRRSGWERHAEEDDRPEPCEHRSWYCKRGEPELELERREIRELVIEARGPAGGREVEVALEHEVVEQANAALDAWRHETPATARLASAAVAASLARSIDEHVVPAVTGLADVSIVVRVEGGEVSQPYHLRKCQRGDDRACRWVEKATWTVTGS